MKWSQVYFRHVKSAVPQPRESLCGFRRVTVARGETATIVLDVPASQLRYWDTKTTNTPWNPASMNCLWAPRRTISERVFPSRSDNEYR